MISLPVELLIGENFELEERSAYQALITKLYRVIPEIEIVEKFYELFSTWLKVLATCSIEIGILRFHI